MTRVQGCDQCCCSQAWLSSTFLVLHHQHVTFIFVLTTWSRKAAILIFIILLLLKVEVRFIYRERYQFQLHNLMSFDKYIQLHNHCFNQDTEHSFTQQVSCAPFPQSISLWLSFAFSSNSYDSVRVHSV